MTHPRTWLLVIGILLGAAGCDSSSSLDPWAVDAGALKLTVSDSPWGMIFHDGDGAEIFTERMDSGSGPTGSIGIFPGPPAEGSGDRSFITPLEAGEPATPPQRDAGWIRATEVLESGSENGIWTATLATTDPDWRIGVRAQEDGDGVISFDISASGGSVQAISVAFVSEEDERFVGFGERGNAVDQSGRTLENYVAEGPYQDAEYRIINAVVPTWGVRWRRDATYFPIPWLLSSRGYGILLDNDELSYHRIGTDEADAWSMEVESSEMRFRVFAGSEPADVLRRFTAAVGSQPRDYAPWFFGPWVQPDSSDRIDELRAADVPTSVTATFTHYLPCGAQRGREDSLRERVARSNAGGTAVHTYFNPMICIDYLPEFDDAESLDALIKNPAGETYTYDYFTSRTFTVSQFDFASPNGVSAYKTLADEAVRHGYEGWMEDFGEYTPLDAVSWDGATGTAFHNRYPRDYHCGVASATSDAGKPLARFVRSGWSGSAACSPIVWGGDPTTSFGFDGLESSVYQALSMGTSGVGIWGSDIGGFFAFQPNVLTNELFDRWIAFGALSVVMRSQKDGTRIPDSVRPQLWDPEHLPIWRRYSKLHTQLYPYIQAAIEEYLSSGMPVMRHHVLTDPTDTMATARSDQYLFGPDILVAPVLERGAIARAVYLPRGTWLNWWRSVDYEEDDGSFHLNAADVKRGGELYPSIQAPLDEIPMFVRAGAVIPMLAPDVYTLAEHGDDPSIVHMSDRLDELHVLAFPRGSSGGTFFAASSFESVESANVWALTIPDTQPRTIYLEATLAALEEPFEPCAIELGDTPLAMTEWGYDSETSVLSVRYRNEGEALQVFGC